jgi:beta-galactosidase
MLPQRLLAPVLACASFASCSPSFAISGNGFVKDGAPYKILSAEMHSSRSHPSDWTARLEAIAALGVNTVTTYVVWSHHEPQPAEFDFDTMPLARWLQAINSSGLLAIARIGPYVTAEFDWGGLPYWLATIPGVRLRTNSTPWLSYVDRYLDALVPVLLPFMYPAGPIISMQVEVRRHACVYEELAVAFISPFRPQDDTDTTIPAAETDAYYEHLISGLRARGVTTLISTLCGFWSGRSTSRMAGLCLSPCHTSIPPAMQRPTPQSLASVPRSPARG